MNPVVTPYPDLLLLNERLTDEQRMVRDSVRAFVSAEAMPRIRDAYREETFPKELVAGMGGLGAFGAFLKEEGLPGLDAVSYGLMMSELERCDSGLRSMASVQGGLVMFPIATFGSPAQKKKWLRPLAEGKAIGCFGLTESEGGSDPGAMKTRAEDKGDHYLLRGSKMWITNGDVSDVAVVWAQTEKGVRGFLVEKGMPGFRTARMKGKLSLRASITSELYFDDVRLPKDALLPGSEGLKSALMCLSQARFSIIWGVLGAAEACFAEALRFTQERVLFGKPLAAKQLVQRKLALMAADITKGQLLAHRLAELKDRGELHFAQVSLGKQNNVEMALQVARQARDLLGAHGIMDEYSTMRHLCNLETVFTYEGTNDVHLLVIGNHLTGFASY